MARRGVLVWTAITAAACFLIAAMMVGATTHLWDITSVLLGVSLLITLVSIALSVL